MRTALSRTLLGVLTIGGTVLVGQQPAGAATTAKQLVSRAITATEAAVTISYTGSVTEHTGTIAFTVASDDRTGEGQGTLGTGGGTAMVRLVNRTIYLNADTAFWTASSGAAAAAEFAGKWVSTSATTVAGRSLAEFLDGLYLLKDIFKPKLTDSVFTYSGTRTVRGRGTTLIRGHNTKKKSGGSLYVAKTGTPYILKLNVTSPKETGSITFFNFNRPVRPKAPLGAINLDQIVVVQKPPKTTVTKPPKTTVPKPPKTGHHKPPKTGHKKKKQSG